jgi:hypothetical protein
MSPPLQLLQGAVLRQDDWQKVGLTLAGVVVGVLLEPVRVWIAASIKRRQIRRLLYRDVARINDCLDFASDQSSKALKEKQTEVPYIVRHYLGEISLDVYEHIFNTERTAFYHLPEALAFKRFYSFVEAHVLSLDADADPADVIEGCTESRSVLKEQTAAGEIDEGRLRAYEKRYAKQQAQRSKKSRAYYDEKLRDFEARIEAAKRRKAANPES